ncbi:MAG: molybdopterin cofactor-binding domain-containing protein, partial [Tahibacter sp.]
MTRTESLVLSRRGFLQGAGVLIIGTFLPMARIAAADAASKAPIVANAFVRIGADSIVTVISKHIEMGQGPYTGLATLVAEELDADWSKIVLESAPFNPEVYKNLSFGFQGTGGSSAIANSYEQMRRVGATARALLVKAAANAWHVPVTQITVENGVIGHAASGRSATLGEFTAAAARLPVPDAKTIALKDPSTFRLIGKDKSVKRVDSAAKSNGTAKFTLDIQDPGLLTVVIARPPRFGAKVVSFDAKEALAVAGVEAVKQISGGVAVYARGSWPALKARKLLKVAWDESAAEKRSSKAIFETFRSQADEPGVVAAKHGDPDAVLANNPQVITAEYAFPFLAHAPMEPLDGYLWWDGKQAKARYGCQLPSLDHPQLVAILGLPAEKVEIETLLAGGSFGRRIDLGNDMVQELAEAAKAIGPNRPIKLMRSREDDIQGGWYRPVMLHRMRGVIRDGKVEAWSNRIVGQSFALGTPFASMIVGGIDGMMVEGSKEIPYTIPNFSCDARISQTGVPTTSLRSVGSTHTAYAVECFMDELLQSAGLDPVEGRLAMMGESPREAGVLRAVAKAANWKGPAPIDGRARGVGLAKSFGSYVAQIADVSLGSDGIPRVHKVWCAIDCGV